VRRNPRKPVEVGATGFRLLRDAWADATTAHGRFMVTILAGLDEFERDLICTRTSEGRARAVFEDAQHQPDATGQHFGHHERHRCPWSRLCGLCRRALLCVVTSGIGTQM
jgi:Resolvase, N terminal domain